MFTAEIFVPCDPARTSEVADALQCLTGTLRKNGQVLGNEWPIAQVPGGLRTWLRVPERESLDKPLHSKWVQQDWRTLLSRAGVAAEVTVLGEDPTGAEADTCERRPSYILFTTYLSIESPLRCGACFRPVPLYRIPHTAGGEYYDVLSWQSDYRSCDGLQMNCGTGEEFATRELSDAESDLSQQGRAICEKIGELTGVPTYYYLYRYGSPDLESENRRRCPGCGGDWLLAFPWYELFDFRCDRCRLVSNIAWDVR